MQDEEVKLAKMIILRLFAEYTFCIAVFGIVNVLEVELVVWGLVSANAFPVL